MIYAVFNADDQVLEVFTDACGAIDPLHLAVKALHSTHSNVAGAFVATLCTRHMEPSISCRTCQAQLRCESCEWPSKACAEHR
ncbi:hypothetical protein [Streptomyces sp. NPDC053048]|uniref:hypothetical protein n=1 Tax=Streptomyces sp. NPDC053048 TaxID=3365694 RepID=UPI0037D6B29C